jgi:hypothetical protein
MPPETTLGSTTSSRRLAVASLVLVVVGVTSYFLFIFKSGGHLAWVRNEAIPNWLAIALGITAAVLALRRAPRALLPKVLLAADIALAALFAHFLYRVPALPEAAGPTVGVAAPDFTLRDQAGQLRTLAGFRGSPLLVVFYRGHW